MNPLKSLPFQALAIVAAGLAAMLFVQTMRLDGAKDALEAKRTELANCEAQHAVTRQSVRALESVIDDLNSRALARGEAYAQGLEEAEKRAVELAKLSAESDRRIDALRRAAREQVNGDCPVPAKLRELADDL